MCKVCRRKFFLLYFEKHKINNRTTVLKLKKEMYRERILFWTYKLIRFSLSILYVSSIAPNIGASPLLATTNLTKLPILLNAAARSFFDRLVAKGKNKKLAVIAVANKLLKQVFGVVKNECLFDRNYYKKIAWNVCFSAQFVLAAVVFFLFYSVCFNWSVRFRFRKITNHIYPTINELKKGTITGDWLFKDWKILIEVGLSEVISYIVAPIIATNGKRKKLKNL